MPAAQSSTPPDRRLIAVGTIRHLDGRTITVRATETGVTGTINRRCPVCRRTFEDCTCTGTLPAAPVMQPFDDDSDDACPLCGDWACTCGAQTTSYTDAARAAHEAHCDRCRTLTQDTTTRAAANGASMRRRDRLTLGLPRAPRPAVTA
ncbi:hypothetical protein [Streptomyces sp. PpalLS-921]|uniref:hypothetical protein n=1 Tax=Streptomyces sp. PpalLS-921 TaxID=1839772 RepID=UPI000B8533CC|nr:hypothetical protein [Streptomyces sp. PpalLS-921]